MSRYRISTMSFMSSLSSHMYTFTKLFDCKICICHQDHSRMCVPGRRAHQSRYGAGSPLATAAPGPTDTYHRYTDLKCMVHSTNTGTYMLQRKSTSGMALFVCRSILSITSPLPWRPPDWSVLGAHILNLTAFVQRTALLSFHSTAEMFHNKSDQIQTNVLILLSLIILCFN